jgi:hypothetical protein
LAVLKGVSNSQPYAVLPDTTLLSSFFLKVTKLNKNTTALSQV